MMTVDATPQLAAVYLALIAALALAGIAIAAMLDREPGPRRADVYLPERLFASEAFAIAAGVALLAVAISALGL